MRLKHGLCRGHPETEEQLVWKLTMSPDALRGLFLCDMQWQLMWTLFNGCDVTSCRYANSVTFFDSQGFSVALCMFPRGHLIYLFSWTDLAGNGIHSNCCTWISQLPLNIYTCEWQSGTNEAFCLFVHLRFLYIVFAARPVELIHWI